MDRKTELEQKKARLEQMRQNKQQISTRTMASARSPVQQNDLNQATRDNDVDLDRILIECGITAPILTSTSGTSSTGVNEDTLQTHHQTTASRFMSSSKNKKPVKLSMQHVNKTEIPPRELVTYTKETQTPATDIPIDKDAKPLDYYVLTYDNIDDDDTVSETTNVGSLHQNVATNTKRDSKTQSNFKVDFDKQFSDPKVKTEVKEISDEEKFQLIQSDDFLKFFSKNSRVLERALDQDDIFFDYTGVDKNKEVVEIGPLLKLNREFYDDRWKNRVITCLDWSQHYPELLLASYEDSPLDPDGVAVVWNSKFKSTCPEYVFNCSSWITSCCFAKFHPNLIIAGTYSGQIVMWDNRSNKRTPIQRSSLSASSHTHPVFCIQVVGSQNAHNLISISNDGKLCSWTLDNMNTPQETLDLQCKQSKNVAVTTMGFRSGDVNNFLIGSEEGPIYTATRHGNKSGINECFEGHYGPVTALSCNQVQGPIDFSHIFLTSSFDWSVKLWNVKDPGKCLYSFENNSDYVYDVHWSPIHPALFASVDGNGHLDLWNLINDTEVPSASVYLDGTPALNKLRWSNNGLQIAVGDDQGKISLFDISENYAQPRHDEWTKFVRVLQDLKQNTSEFDDNNGVTTANTTSTQLQPLLGSSSTSTQMSQTSSPLHTIKSEPNLSLNTSTTSSIQQNLTSTSTSNTSILNGLQMKAPSANK